MCLSKDTATTQAQQPEVTQPISIPTRSDSQEPYSRQPSHKGCTMELESDSAYPDASRPALASMASMGGRSFTYPGNLSTVADADADEESDYLEAELEEWHEPSTSPRALFHSLSAEDVTTVLRRFNAATAAASTCDTHCTDPSVIITTVTATSLSTASSSSSAHSLLELQLAEVAFMVQRCQQDPQLWELLQREMAGCTQPLPAAAKPANALQESVLHAQLTDMQAKLAVKERDLAKLEQLYQQARSEGEATVARVKQLERQADTLRSQLTQLEAAASETQLPILVGQLELQVRNLRTNLTPRPEIVVQELLKGDPTEVGERTVHRVLFNGQPAAQKTYRIQDQDQLPRCCREVAYLQELIRPHLLGPGRAPELLHHELRPATDPVHAATHPFELIVVTKWMAGGDLQQLVDSRQATPRQVLSSVQQTADVHVKLAAQRFVNGDIKPENMCNTSTDASADVNVAILDVDTLVALPEGCDEARARGVTYHFCAPEVVKTGKTSLAADVFSMGKMIMEMVTALQQQKNEGQDSAEWVSEEAKALGEQLTFIASKCIKTTPSKRPTMAKVAQRLAAIEL